MKNIFSGNKKFLTIPAAIILGLTFFPFTISTLLYLLVKKKISNKTIRYASFAAIALFTLFFGSAWLVAMTTPTENIAENKPTVSEPEPSVKTPQQEASPVKTETVTTQAPSPTTSSQNLNRTEARVVAIIDGDTIDVNIAGEIKRLRYIGIDTPESVDPRTTLQCFGKESTAKNRELVENKIVTLEKDVSETDRYGRLLRYVYVGNVFINEALVSQGFAHASSYPPDIKHQNILDAAEKAARNSNKGLWNSCATSPVPTTKPSSTNSGSPAGNNSPQTNTGGACKYSCTSPDRDCSDFSSHAEAQSFFSCCGFTAENDPMKLDALGVGDGIACENI